jgi:hypothetical protein
MRLIILLLIVAVLNSCASKPFLKHKMQYKKINSDCSGQDPGYKMNSNINGERYEFQECLDSDFDGNNYKVVRNGDTVVVSFTSAMNKKSKSLFGITLDIDTYPRYNFMTIGDYTFSIVPEGN